MAILAMLVFCVGAFPETTQATLMSGSVNFSGVVQFDTGNVNTANTISKWGKNLVEGADGSFAGLTRGSAVSVTAPWGFDPSAPMNSLWSVGGFTFDLLTSTIVTQSGGLLVLSGTGMMSNAGSGFEATFGTWTFTSQDGVSRSGFSFTTGASDVPDGGSAVALLGMALLGMEVLRRRLAASRQIAE